MLSKTKSWYSGLSSVGKVLLWAISAVITGSVISSAASPITQPRLAIKENSQTQTESAPILETKTQTETETIPFAKISINDSSLEKGKTQLKKVGVTGTKTKTYKVTYENGRQKEKLLVSEVVTKEAVNEITALGTYIVPSSCDPNYTPCVPNVSYDLDCPDIGFSVTIIGSDPHGFDGRDNDGYGCESY